MEIMSIHIIGSCDDNQQKSRVMDYNRCFPRKIYDENTSRPRYFAASFNAFVDLEITRTTLCMATPAYN